MRLFRIILPSKDKAHLVASRSYLSYSKAELRDKLLRNPYSYLHVINPDGQQKIDAKRGTQWFFQQVKKKFNAFVEYGWLQPSHEPTIAVYRQTSSSGSCTGVVGLIDMKFIEQGKLKKHEQTLKIRESLFTAYLEEVGCNAEPVLCAFPEDNLASTKLTAHLAAIASAPSDFDFSTTDCIRHTIWILKPEQAEQLSAVSSQLSKLCIADGHHRVASSIELAKRFPDDHNKQGILAYAIPESEVIIRGYHREVVKSNHTLHDWTALFVTLKNECKCEPLTAPFNAPESPGIIHVHTAHGSWKWTLHEAFSEGVDTDWLFQSILRPFFDISDARNDPRLKYLPGTLASSELSSRILKYPDRCIFEMYPILMSKIKSIADTGGTLPPKSTWIEPKLRSGLFIHSFEK